MVANPLSKVRTPGSPERYASITCFSCQNPRALAGGILRVGGGIVACEPGARTHWHTHPLGQALIVLTGVGWTQCDGGPRTKIRAGDIVSCACGKRHWHGAAQTTAMSHMAIVKTLDGENVEWMEPVIDEQYLEGVLITDCSALHCCALRRKGGAPSPGAFLYRSQ